MRSILMSVLALGAASAHALKPEDISGSYAEPGGVFVYSGNPELGLDGQEMMGTEDTLEIAKKSATSINFHVTSIGGNAHICDLEGTAKLQGSAFVWVAKDPQVGVCKISISLDNAKRQLSFDAEGDLCRDYCGMRASFPPLFSMNARKLPNGKAATRIRPVKGEKLCFSRIYDTPHLRQHKGQKAASMYLTLNTQDAGNFYDAKLVVRKATENPEKNFEFTTEEDELKAHFSGWASCPTTGGAASPLDCVIPSDAGSFQIQLLTDGSVLVKPAPNEHGMVLMSMLDNDALPTDKTELLRVTGNAENRAYKLYPAISSNCASPY